MKPRLLFLIALAGGLAIYFAVSKNSPAVPTEGNDAEKYIGDKQSGLTHAQLEQAKTTLDSRELPGTEPAEPPDVTVTVDVDTSTGKNRLYVNLSESHGYYVETFRVQLWYKETPDMVYEDSPLTLEHYMDRYIKAGETLRDCLEVVPTELQRIGGDIGTTEKWGARVSYFGRYRAKNPDPLPILLPNTRCTG